MSHGERKQAWKEAKQPVGAGAGGQAEDCRAEPRKEEAAGSERGQPWRGGRSRWLTPARHPPAPRSSSGPAPASHSETGSRRTAGQGASGTSRRRQGGGRAVGQDRPVGRPRGRQQPRGRRARSRQPQRPGPAGHSPTRRRRQRPPGAAPSRRRAHRTDSKTWCRRGVSGPRRPATYSAAGRPAPEGEERRGRGGGSPGTGQPSPAPTGRAGVRSRLGPRQGAAARSPARLAPCGPGLQGALSALIQTKLGRPQMFLGVHSIRQSRLKTNFSDISWP